MPKEKTNSEENLVIQKKKVKNKGNQKIELSLNDSVLVFLPGEVKSVPASLTIPKGIGLFEV